jgi:hypothetical protein
MTPAARLRRSTHNKSDEGDSGQAEIGFLRWCRLMLLLIVPSAREILGVGRRSVTSDGAMSPFPALTVEAKAETALKRLLLEKCCRGIVGCRR